MLHDFDWERRDKSEKEFEVKLQAHVDVYNESQRLMQILKEDNEKWENKKNDVEATVKEISVEK